MKTTSPDRLQKNLLLLVIIGTPLLLAIIARVLWMQSVSGDIDLVGTLGTKNKGILVNPPFQIHQWNFMSAGGKPVDFDASPGKWTFLIPGRSGCDDSCQKKLWETRQIHTALGKNSRHVRRVYLNLDVMVDADLTELIKKEHVGLETFHVDPAQFLAFGKSLAVKDPIDEHWFFVVDPDGWIMMYYTPEHDYKDVIADMKLLLNVAQH